MRWLYLLILLLIPSLADATCTVTTADLQQTTITTAIAAATEGDVICLPAGTQTWTTTTNSVASVTINKAITLQGLSSCTGTPVTCTDTTIILDGTTTTASSTPIRMTANNSRVTAISFQDPRSVSDSGAIIEMGCTDCRVDHSSFVRTGTGTVRGISPEYISSTSSKLIDHNYFKHLNTAVSPQGSITGEGTAPNYRGNSSWASPMTPGDAYAVYIEDNNFDFPDLTLNGALDAYDGSRTVFRFNTVLGTNTAGHGFDSSQRSALRAEVYRNVISNPRAGNVAIFYQTRGGHHYVWQNNVSAANGSYSKLYDITNYRSGDTTCSVCGDKGMCDGTNIRDQNTGGAEGYACRDQVGRGPSTNSANDWPLNVTPPNFYQPLMPAASWGNTFKGHAVTSADIDVLSGATQTAPASGPSGSVRMLAYHMLADRDYYVEAASFNGESGTGQGTLAARPPTCTTGVFYFATDQGSWNTSTTDASFNPSTVAGEDGLLYRCTATDTWTLAYTPYDYPHPLQNAGAPPVPDPVSTFTVGSTTAGAYSILIWSAGDETGVDFGGYRVYCGTSPGVYDSEPAYATTPSLARSQHTSSTRALITFPTAGTYYCAGTVYDLAGVNSAYSSEVTITSTGIAARSARQ